MTTNLKASPVFRSCNTAGALLQSMVISTDYPSWSAGQHVNLKISGNLAKQVDDGEIVAQATFVGINVLDNKDNMCSYSGTPFKCPLPAGQSTWDMPFDLAAVPFAGTLASHMALTSIIPSRQQIACIDFDIDLS
jgi:hypothetical protein